jgi:nucleoside-diphosphate-sugar epimerase
MATFTIFGAGGWVGSALVQRLESHAHDVQALRRNEWPSENTNLGHVIYSIGLTADFRSRPLETAEAHVTVLTQVLRRCKFESLLYLSTTRIYRDARETAESAVLQVKPADPDDVYNITKLAGEALCLSLPNPTTRVARLSNVIGAGAQSDSFLASVMRDARKGAVTIHGAPDSVKDYVALSDVTLLCEAIAIRGQQRLYNVAAGRNVSHRTIADLVARHTGATVKFAPNAPKQQFPPIAIDLIQREFGAKPLAFETAFAQMFQADRGAA